jgi:hypothetical protein
MSPHVAAPRCIEQLGGKAEHVRRDGPALLFVAVEQGLGGAAAGDRRQLPAEVAGVLHAGVQALASGWRMHVRGVADQQHAPDLVAVGQPGVHVERRGP